MSLLDFVLNTNHISVNTHLTIEYIISIDNHLYLKHKYEQLNFKFKITDVYIKFIPILNLVMFR
jgi:hypothetical protein